MSRDRTPEEILKTGSETYAEKNEDYSDSWRTAGEILFKMADEEPVTLDSAEDWIMVGLYTRRLDKFLRSFNGEFLADGMNFESVFDTHADESVYAAMAAAMADEQAPEPDDTMDDPAETEAGDSP